MSYMRRIIETSKAVKSYLYALFSDGYTFSNTDLYLYFNERYCIKRPPVTIVSHKDDGLDLLKIGERHVFWPAVMSSADVSWLFGEIFVPWGENPSSYDHPVLCFHDANWVIDAGACEGFFSLFALERGARRVIAVEPMESLWCALRRTFADQTEKGRFELSEGGLGREAGKAHLNFDPLHACDATVVSAVTGCPVTLTTLDQLGKRYSLEAGGIVKMDIEGAEMDALQGGARLLREHKPKLAVAVYHGYENAQRCKEIILKVNPDYTIEFRGMYGWFSPPRPYMLFAW